MPPQARAPIGIAVVVSVRRPVHVVRIIPIADVVGRPVAVIAGTPPAEVSRPVRAWTPAAPVGIPCAPIWIPVRTPERRAKRHTQGEAGETGAEAPAPAAVPTAAAPT